MKRILAIALCLVLAVMCFAGCGSNEKVIKIGVYEPTTGNNGAGGKQEVLGMQYANSITPTITIGGEEYKVELVYADNESSTDKAVSAATKLVSEGCSVVLGSYGSSVAIAGSATFGDAGIPVIGVTCTNPQVTEGNSHYFRICFLDPFQGTVLANFSKEELKAKTVYCLGELGNDYDQGLIKYFSEASKKLGMKVITESFQKDSSDFNSFLTNAKNKNADVIFAPCSINYAQLIVEQAAAQGIKCPLIASDTWDSNVILEAAKNKDLDIYVTTFYQEGGNPEFDKGIKEWLNKEGNEDYLKNNGGNDMISAVSTMGYDAYNTAIEAIKAADSKNPADILAKLPTITHSGVSGEISFNEIGDANRNVAYVKKANTKTVNWEFVKEQSVAE